MSYVASRQRINGDAADAISGLAAKPVQPQAKVIELALHALSDKIFGRDRASDALFKDEAR